MGNPVKKTEKNEEKKAGGGLLGTAAVMAFIILFSKALGLVRDLLVARAWGTTAPAVAYETASRLPILIFDLVLGGVVSAAFIPVFSDLLVREGKRSAMRYAASYVNMIFCLTGAITLLGVLFASPLVSFLAPDLPPETAELASRLTVILFPMVICTGLAYSFVGILQSMGEFRIPALISLVSNAIMVVYLLFFRERFGIYGLAVAMLLGWAAQMVVQIPKLRVFGFRLMPGAGIFSPHTKRSLKMALPILIGTWTQPICAVINTRFASAMEAGGAISALGYANRLYTIIVGVFSFVATNLLFPYFSRAASSGEVERSRHLMLSSVKTLSFIIAPIAVGVAILARPISAILYQGGSFTEADTALTAAALRCYAVGMLFMAANEVLTKAFFAESRPRLPMYASLGAMAANVVLVNLLAPMGIGGIALASGLASGVQFVLNVIFWRRHTGAWIPASDFLDMGRSVLSALVMGAALLLLLPYLPQSSILQCVTAAAAGAVIYAVCTALIRSEEAGFLLRRIVRKKTTQ